MRMKLMFTNVTAALAALGPCMVCLELCNQGVMVSNVPHSPFTHYCKGNFPWVYSVPWMVASSVLSALELATWWVDTYLGR